VKIAKGIIGILSLLDIGSHGCASCNFLPISCCISETVTDRDIVTIVQD